jgi:MinD superfamily P-loop ATPase
MNYTITADCLDCGICEAMCARGAIVPAKRQFVIKKSKCNGCAICAPYCPARAIVPRGAVAARHVPGRRSVRVGALKPSD